MHENLNRQGWHWRGQQLLQKMQQLAFIIIIFHNEFYRTETSEMERGLLYLLSNKQGNRAFLQEAKISKSGVAGGTCYSFL